MKRFIIPMLINIGVFGCVILLCEWEDVIALPEVLVMAVMSLLVLLWIICKCLASPTVAFSKTQYALLAFNLVSGGALVGMVAVDPPFVPGLYLCLYNIVIMLSMNVLRYEVLSQFKKHRMYRLSLSLVWMIELNAIVLYRAYDHMGVAFSLQAVMLPMAILFLLSGAVAYTAMCDTVVRFTAKLAVLILASALLLFNMDQGQLSISISYSWLWATILLPLVGGIYSITINRDF